MDDSKLRALAAGTAEVRPRVLVLAAPPGYGKRTFLRSYANHAGSLNFCDLGLPGEVESARLVLDALVASHPSRAARSAVDRLIQRRPATTLREVLRREWSATDRAELFVLHDPALVLATPAGLDLLGELVRMLPPERTLAISIWPDVPPALDHLLARERPTVIRTDDLALTVDEVTALAHESGLTDATAQAIHRCANGWPLVSRVIADLMRRRPASDVLEAAAALPGESLLRFALHRSVAALAEPVRETLAVATIMPNAAYARIVRVLGDACDDVVFDQTVTLPFVEVEQGAVRIHPSASALLRERFEPLLRDVTERILTVLIGDGAHSEAAQVALNYGDPVRAATIIDAAPPYTATAISPADYERVLERLDRNLITRFPNLWIATIPYRSLSIEPATYVREAETVYFCLSAAAGADQRAAAVMLLASAYANVGRSLDSQRLVDEALDGFARKPSSARAAILNFSASLRGIEGRFALARSLAREAAALSRDEFGENQTLHYVEAHEAAYRGQQDRAVVILDELMLRRARESLPLYLAYVATNGMIISWANGDDASFARYLSALEASVTPGLEPGFAPLIDAAREWPVDFPVEHPWPVVTAMVQLYRMGSAKSDEAALDAARAAARAADQRLDPYTQVLAHTALFVLDEANRSGEAETLAAIVAPLESPELQEAVRSLLAGGSAGMLDPFIRVRVLRRREMPKALLRIELIAGRVTRSGVVVPLNKKEFQVIALLASTRGALSRESIGEALWDHLDPEKWGNNMKVTVNRIRKKLGHDAIVSEEVTRRYRLGATVDIDLRRLEMSLRQRSLSADIRTFFKTAQCDLTLYEDSAWGQVLAARIKDVFCSVGVMLAESAFESGEYDAAQEYAAKAAAIDPFHEKACELVVRARLARGDADGARHEFQRYAKELKAEFGVEPSRRFADLVGGSKA